MKSFCYKLALAALFIAAAVLPLAAQAPTGSLVGIVSDPTQSAVPKAQIRLRNTDTNFIQNFVTEENGIFRFPALTAGNYELTVEAQGFRKVVQNRVAIPAAQTVRLDVQLTLGDVTATVEVSGKAVGVDTETSTLRGVVDTKRVSELPLNGRDVAKLVLLVPGTLDAPVGTYQQTFSFPGRSAIPSNGGRGNMVNYSLDGSNANDNYTNVNNPLPNPDVVQEIVVQTSNFSARYGQSGGAMVNVVTRSGTNALHGSAFEYLRNDALNAKNFFTGQTDGLKRNQYGFSVGGPVVAPHLYDGRNRTFFFTSWQGTTIRQRPTSNLVTLPTAEQRNGDFSALGRPIIDPDTKAAFLNNRIPPERIGSFARNLFKYLPIPAPLAGFGPGTTFITIPNREDLWEYLIKIDHHTGSKNQLTGRYYITNYSQPSYFADNNLVTARGGKDSRYQSIALNDTHTIRPELVNEFIFSYDRTQTISTLGAPLSARDDLGVNIYAPKPSQIQFGVSGNFSINTGVDFSSPRNTFQWADNLNYFRGRHQLSLGTSISRLQMSLVNPFIVTGSWSYNGSVTGSQLADLVLGKPSSFSQGGGQYVQIRGTLYGFYLQDDFKVSRKLTLNLGLRYEPYFPFHDKQGRGATFAPGRQSQVYPLAPGGILYEGDEGVGQGHQRQDLNNLAPRVGFAFDPSGNRKLSIRGGYGIFYDINPTKTYIGFGQVPPFSSQIDLFNPPSDSDPLRLVGNPFPLPPASKTTPIPRPVSLNARDANRRTSYVQSWNFSVEREFAASLVGRASYVGSKGTKLETSYEANPAVYIPGASSTANTNERRIYFSQGLGSVNAGSTEGLSSYHAMQLQLDHRLRASLAVQAGYTFSKSIDNISIVNGTSPQFVNPSNKNAYRGLSDFDSPHRFVLSYVWSVPQPEWSGLARTLIGGWSTSGIISTQAGQPLSILAGQDRSLSSVGRDFADVVGNPHLDHPSLQAWFNRDAFVLPALGTFGNSGRSLLRGPGFWNMDVSAVKDFAFAETRKLQFRAEFFNALNHVNPGNPSTTLNTPTFARITSYRGPRIVQLSLRLQF